MRTSIVRGKGELAILIPKELADGLRIGEVNIIRDGGTLVIAPVKGGWRSFFDGPRATADFMLDRSQPPLE